MCSGEQPSPDVLALLRENAIPEDPDFDRKMQGFWDRMRDLEAQARGLEPHVPREEKRGTEREDGDKETDRPAGRA